MSELDDRSSNTQETQQPAEQNINDGQNRLDDIADSHESYQAEKPLQPEQFEPCENPVDNREYPVESAEISPAEPEKKVGQERLDDIADSGKVEPVHGRMPLNCEYAGKTYPPDQLPPELCEKYPESVNFNEKGFADFSPYCKVDVDIQYTGDRRLDNAAANREAGFAKTPEGYTWHHHENAKTMQLVPTDIHKEVKHTGGCATSGMEYNKRK